MVFVSLVLHEDSVITAVATGHATEVVQAFHVVASLLLSSRGPWRITEMNGSIPDDDRFDSEMQWNMVAKTKSVQ